MRVRISPTSPLHCLAVSYAAEGSQNQLTSPTPSCIAVQQVSQLWCASALGVRRVGFAHARPIMLSIALVLYPYVLAPDGPCINAHTGRDVTLAGPRPRATRKHRAGSLKVQRSPKSASRRDIFTTVSSCLCELTSHRLALIIV